MADLKAIAKEQGLTLAELEAYLEQHEPPERKVLTGYEARRRGRDYCQTDGEEHYQHGGIEQIDYIIARGWSNGFCKGSVTKYLARHDYTGNTGDLRKAADYLHILAGVELAEKEGDK